MKKTVAFLLVCLLVFCTACGSSGTTAAPTEAPAASGSASGASAPAAAAPAEKSYDKVTLKVATILTPGEPAANQIDAFAQRVMDRTDGLLEVQVYHSGSLYATNNDIFESILRGGNVIAFADPAKMSEYVPDYAIMQHPYLYNDYSDIKKVGTSDWGQEMVEEAAAAGIRVLDCMTTYYGTRHTVSTKVFTNPEEMKGILMRVPATPMWISTVTAMGASPTTIAWGETYSALSQGVADAAEGPLPSIYAAKFHEVAKNLMLTGHFIAPGGLEMSEKVFRSLPEEWQAILQEEALAFAELATQETLEKEATVLDELKAEGVTVYEVDEAAFRDACKDVYKDFPEWTDGAFERVKAIVAG